MTVDTKHQNGSCPGKYFFPTDLDLKKWRNLTSQFFGLVTNVHTKIIIYLYTTYGRSKRKHRRAEANLQSNKSNYWDFCFSGMLHGVGRQMVTDSLAPTGCPKTLVINYQRTPCNIPEERRPELRHGGSCKITKKLLLLLLSSSSLLLNVHKAR
jgi:hypothetical protein